MNGLINTQTEIYSLRRNGDGVLLNKCVYLTCKHIIIILYNIYVHIILCTLDKKKLKIPLPASLYL